MIRRLASPTRSGLAWAVVSAVGLGGLHSVAFVHTDLWWLPLLIVAVLARVAATLSPGRAAAVGWVFGTAWLATSTWWLYVSLHIFGGLPAWMAVVAVIGLSAFLSSYLAAAFGAFARWRSGFAGRDALLFGALWLLAELARGVIFTGFPWAASGYAQVDSPFAVLAPWIGVYGIGFVVVTMAAWPGLASPGDRAWRPVPTALAFGLVALAIAAGAAGPVSFTQPAGRLSVSLIQGNVPQEEKFEAEHIPEVLGSAFDQLMAARGELVVAPETVIPVLPVQLDPGYWAALTGHFGGGAQAALIGLPLGDEVVGYTNSAAGLSAATVASPAGLYRYDKHHLVPFGEFVPTGFHWFTALMNIPLGDFNRGPVGAASFAVRDQRVGANICYEDLFGEELAARFVDDAAAPTLFANISNIGWFGNTIAIDQHLQISRMRTLEFQRPMIRATNTGATAIIDHQGRVTAALPRYTRGTLDGEVEGRTGLTPFARWASRLDLCPLWAAALLIVGIAARTGRRARDSRRRGR